MYVCYHVRIKFTYAHMEKVYEKLKTILIKENLRWNCSKYSSICRRLHFKPLISFENFFELGCKDHDFDKLHP